MARCLYRRTVFIICISPQKAAFLLAIAVASVMLAACGDDSPTSPTSPSSQPPSVSAISPASSAPGSTLTVTITGTNFTSANPALTFSGTGITVSNLSVQNTTTATAAVAIAADASSGARTISVNGVSGTVTFTVTAATPALTAVSPNTIVSGTATVVTLSGTGFASGSSVAVSGSGVAVSDVSVVSATSMTARLTVDGAADIGGRSLSVTTPAGTTAPQTLTVNPTTPTINTATPSAAAPGSTVDVTFRGTGFAPGATTVSVSGGGVTVLSTSVAATGDHVGAQHAIGPMAAGNGTSLVVRLAIDANATPGPRAVTVSTPGGSSATFTFTIGSAFPVIGGFSARPGIIQRGASSTLSWSGVANASTCSINNNIGNVSCANGSVVITPSATTEYMFSASGPGGREWMYVTVNVEEPPPPPTAGNSAPTIGDISNQTINEDAATTALAFTVGDQETTPGSLTLSGTSSNTTLVPNTNIVFGGSGASRTVTVTPADDQSGTATITVTVSDGTASASDPLTLTVTQLFDDQQIFTTAGSDTFVVPAGVTSITIEASGAQGGSGNGAGIAAGANGGSVTGTITVTPEETLSIFVGGQGGSSIPPAPGSGGINGGATGGNGRQWQGGGGGGASDVRQLGVRVVVAGGGGGSGSAITHTFGAGPGGAGGGTTGGNGSAGGGLVFGGGGQGGGSGSGGAGGSGQTSCATCAGASGISGSGGVGSGGSDTGGGGGGGGSSFTTAGATNVTHTQGNRTGNGRVIITW